MIEINPMMVMVVAEQLLEQGWIQGTEHGRRNDNDTDQDPQGVCVVGALRTALADCLKSPVIAMLEPLPEFQALGLGDRRRFVNGVVHTHTDGLLKVFRQRIEPVLGGSGIEAWNDNAKRRKQEVLEAMRASLEIVTAECLHAWSAEADREATMNVDVPVEAMVLKA